MVQWVDTDSMASGLSVMRAEPGKGLGSEGICLGLHRVTASCMCGCLFLLTCTLLPSLAVTPTAPSSQLLGFVQTVCLIPQALAGKAAVVSWSECGDGERRQSQVAAAWSFQLGWHCGEMALVVNLWLPHAHVHTRVLTCTRTHIQCVTDGGFKERRGRQERVCWRNHRGGFIRTGYLKESRLSDRLAHQYINESLPDKRGGYYDFL